MNYAIARHPNSAMFTVHLECRLPHIGMFASDRIDSKGLYLKQQILLIPGVQDVTAHDYRLTITRGGVHSVGNLIPKLLDVLADAMEIKTPFIAVELYPD